MAGYVYCLTNKAIPKLVKIGKTARNPLVRAAEISAATGVPTPFEVAWAREVPDMNAAENALHKALSEYRLSRRREFFRCTPAEALSRSKKLSSFRAKKTSARKRRHNFDVPMGLAMTTATLGVFGAGIVYDLEASTIATATAGIALVLTLIFQSVPIIRMFKG